MITLFAFGPMFGLPDASPFVTKADVLLKMSGLPYACDFKGFAKAPNGKLPYIRDDDTIIADSSFIRLHLEQKHAIDFDAGLTARDRGIAWSIEKLCEDHLYWIMVNYRWLDDANFSRGPARCFEGIPLPMRGLVKRMIRRKMRKTLHAHGMGRHSLADMNRLADRALQSIAAALADGPWLMGSRRCGADATVFAFVFSILCPHFESPVRTIAERHDNLVAYCDRMRQDFYPESGTSQRAA